MTLYIIDIILAAVFIFITIRYTVKGFAKSILDFVSFFLALVLTGTVAEKITDWIFSNTKLFAGMEHYIATLIIFILTFVILSALLEGIVKVINKFFKIPVLKQLNKLLGLVLGALCGAIIVVVLSVGFQVSSNLIYNAKYVSAVENSRIVQTVLSDEKVAENLEAFK